MCNAREQADCLEQFGERGMAWACEECPKSKPEDLMPYTHKLLNAYNLQRGGYPLEANDLTPEEWLDLARVRDLFQPSFQCPYQRKRE